MGKGMCARAGAPGRLGVQYSMPRGMHRPTLHARGWYGGRITTERETYPRQGATRRRLRRHCLGREKKREQAEGSHRLSLSTRV